MDAQTCTCSTQYDEYTGLETDSFMCDRCMLDQGICDCSKTARCHLCDLREPMEITLAHKERADANLIEACNMFREAYEKWNGEVALGISTAVYIRECTNLEYCSCDNCIYSPGPDLDLTTERDIYRMRIAIQTLDDHDCYETAKWFKSWQKRDPLHLDPSAWNWNFTLRLTWNARKLAENS
jgi:hypothetical protein